MMARRLHTMSYFRRVCLRGLALRQMPSQGRCSSVLLVLVSCPYLFLVGGRDGGTCTHKPPNFESGRSTNSLQWHIPLPTAPCYQEAVRKRKPVQSRDG